jgi:hypothetical protein
VADKPSEHGGLEKETKSSLIYGQSFLFLVQEDVLLLMQEDQTHTEPYRVNQTAAGRFPRLKKTVGKPVKPAGLLLLKKYKHGLLVGPDRFVYRAGPVPPGTGRTGPVPNGLVNPGAI